MPTSDTLSAKNLQQAIVKYSDEQFCIDTVAALRWPNGVTCPDCGNKEHWYLKTQKRNRQLEIRQLQTCLPLATCAQQIVSRLLISTHTKPEAHQKGGPVYWREYLETDSIGPIFEIVEAQVDFPIKATIEVQNGTIHRVIYI